MFTFQTLETTTVNIHNVTATHYGPFVYLAVKERMRVVRMVEGDRPKVKDATKDWGFCIGAAKFEKLLAEHGSNPEWVIDMWFNSSESDEFTAISEDEFRAYVQGKHHIWSHEHRGQDRPEIDLLKTLQAGDYHRVVSYRIGNDGFLYDANGEKVMRAFPLDYISGAIKQREYHLTKVRKHLEGNPEIVELETISIPYYNADFAGEKAIEFIWVPPDLETFRSVANVKDSFMRTVAIKGRLGLDQFRREEPEPDED